jgi:hypothetical protein
MTAPEETPEVEAGEDRSSLPASLRPYLPGREIVVSLCSGSAALSRRIWAWITANGWRSARDRVLGLGAGVYVAAYLAQSPTPYAPFVAPVGVGAWCIAALALSPGRVGGSAADDEDQDHDEDELADDDEDQEEDELTPSPPPLHVAHVARLVREIAAAGGHQGAHLDDVLAMLPGHTKPELIAVLDGAGIEVADQLKIRLPGGRQRNRQGVRLSALPPGLGETPPPPPVTNLSKAPAAGPVEAPSNPSPPPPPAALPETPVGG